MYTMYSITSTFLPFSCSPWLLWVLPLNFVPSSFYFLTHWVQFVLPIWTWMWGHPLAYDRSASGHTPGENSFSSSNQLLLIILHHGWGIMGFSPLHAGTLTVFILCYSGYEFKEARSCHVQKTPQVSSSIFPPPLLRQSLNLEGSKCDGDVVLRTPSLLILIKVTFILRMLIIAKKMLD